MSRVRTGAIWSALVLAAPAAAQAQAVCTPTSVLHVAATAALVRVEVAGGRTVGGWEAGVEAGKGFGSLHVTGTAAYSALDGAAASPISLGIRAEHVLVEVIGISVCGAVLGAATVTSAGDDRAWTAAGGAALTAARGFAAGGVRITPYVGIRGLGARTAGEILDQEFAASGTSLGVEGGVAAEGGRFGMALRVTGDGLDPALGPTLYPALAVRLLAALRF